ncbi:MAG: hypothetical protein R3E39_28095 [Anaerolineae bacterium]
MIPDRESTTESANGRRSTKLTIVGLLGMLALGVILLFAGGLAAGVAGAAAVIIAVIALAVTLMSGNVLRPETSAEKRKRGLNGLDMYTLIDRMVDDLDEEELAYLRRRLEQKDNKEDLPHTVADLLDYREEERQAGRR